MKILHKLLIVVYFGIFTLFLKGCSDFFGNPALPELEYGNFDFKDTLDLVDSIQFGEKIQDSIAIVFYNECYSNPYFQIKNINEFTIEFRLYYNLTSQNCKGHPIIKSKTSFDFTPSKKGNYTLLIRDRLYTFQKKLVVY
jgi:hypothetical protein